MGKASRDKGKRGELHARDLMRRVWPKAKRTGDQWTGADRCDVENTPYWLEVKHGATIALWAAMRQAETDRAAAGQPERPILLYLRLDRRPPVVVMLADEWIEREAAAALGRIIG